MNEQEIHRIEDGGYDERERQREDEELRDLELRLSRTLSHFSRRRSTATRGTEHDTEHGDASSETAAAHDRRPREAGREKAASSAEPSPSPVQKETDPFEVGWEGGDADPLCPRSMPPWRKWLIVIVTSIGSLCVTCASSIYTSSYTNMDREFGNSTLIATLGLSTFVLGIALGPAWSPLSEFYGRRPIYLGSFVLFTIWIIPSAVAQNIETMIVARFFQGVSGSAFLSVAGGTVGDLFTRDTMQVPMALFTSAPFVGPSIGPLIGGFINSNVDWRWTHYVLIIWGACLFVALYVLVPETYHPIVLRNKARALRRATGDERWRAPIEKSSRSIRLALGIAMLRPFQLIAYEPMCLALDLYSAVLLGILYLFFGAFPLVFEGNHGFNLWQAGLSFMGILVGSIIAAICSPVWTIIRVRLMRRRQLAAGAATPISEPEDRLPAVMAGAVLVPIGIFWFGWTSYSSIHWIVPIIGSTFFAVGTVFAFTGIFTFFVDAYQLYAASALAGNAFVRCTSAAAFPLFGIQMYHKLGDQWASSLLAFLALAMLPFPFLFFKYGKKLRGKSRYAID